MAITPTIDLELEFSAGVWTSVWADVRISDGVPLVYGIQGTSPKDRIASTGRLSFSLNNEGNSGGVVGYYSPDHANVRSGFEIGILVRLSITYSGTTYYKFVGTLADIKPSMGVAQLRVTKCTAVDWFDEIAHGKLARIPTQTNKSADELITTLSAATTRQPTSTNLDVGRDLFSFALDTARDEGLGLFSELQKIVMSELGYLYIIGDTSAGGVLRFEDRSARLRAGPEASLTTINDTMIDMTVERSRETIYNKIIMTAHPRRVDVLDTVVVFSLKKPFSIAPGETIVIDGRYTDPTEVAERVGAIDIITPVSGTDYIIRDSDEDTAADITGDHTVTPVTGGNSVRWTIVNNGSVTGWVMTLQVRGRGVYDYDPIVSEAEDSASQDDFGENILSIDMPYQDNTNVAASLSAYELSQRKDPRTDVSHVGFLGNSSDALMTAGLAREPGDEVTLVETVTGINGGFFINGCNLTIMPASIVKFGWTVVPQTDTTEYWLLGTAGRGELGTNTRLGP